MINKRFFTGNHPFCKDFTKIENYGKAVLDTQVWDCHHRLETHYKKDGIWVERNKDEQITKEQLIKDGVYYNVEPCMLIFLRQDEHRRLHYKDRHHTEEAKSHMKQGAKTRKKKGHLTEEHKKHLSESLKGRKKPPITEEHKRNLSLTLMGNKNGCKKVVCVETNEIFESLKAAGKSVGTSNSKICTAIKTGGRSGGFHWKYYDPEIKD